MLKINNQNVDLILQLEEHSSIQKIFNLLSLDIDNILIICPKLFLERFIHFNYETFTNDSLSFIEYSLISNKDFISIPVTYKRIIYNFHFILTNSETKIISNPFKGEQVFNVGFKEVKIK